MSRFGPKRSRARASHGVRKPWSVRRLCVLGCVPIAFFGLVFLWVKHATKVLLHVPSTGVKTEPATLRDVRSVEISDAQVHVSAASEIADVHIVFSTDCSGYQHWQSIALWYTAQFSGQIGPITRVASGCSPQQQAVISKEWRQIDRSGRFRVHFTPPMELPGRYKYSNKPGGLLHWLHRANPPIAEPFVALIDPDMLLYRPLTTRLAEGLTPASRANKAGRAQEELQDERGVGQILTVASVTPVESLPPRVALGQPAGQHFGIGGQWSRAMSTSARPGSAWASFSKAHVCGTGAPCTHTSNRDADHLYAAGPVYLAHVDDWRRIAEAWWDFVPRVHEQYPQLLAEMYAFTMAVANLTLPWNLVSSYMVSDPKTQSPTEAWAWIEDLAADDASAICAGATSTELPFATRDRSAVALPVVLHYCQKYTAAGHIFAKHKVPGDFFKCDGEPMPFDAATLIADLEAHQKGTKEHSTSLRVAFLLCHLIPLANRALTAYQKDVCADSGLVHQRAT